MNRGIAAAIVLVMVVATHARAQSPVLAYAARVGPALSNVQTVAVGADGSVFVSGRIGTGSEGGAAASPQSYVARLSPDGAEVQCSYPVDGVVVAMAPAGDGTVVLAGSTANATFPVTTTTPGSTGGYLLQADICERRVSYATWLPPSTVVTSLATGGNGIWLATGNAVLRYSPGDGQPSAQASLDGIPGAIAFRNGHVYVAGVRGQGPFRAFLASLDPVTLKAEYDVAWGQGPAASGTGIAVSSDGSVWVAGAAITTGGTPGVNYPASGGVPYFGGFAMLTLVAPGGNVLNSRVTDLKLGGSNPSVGLSPDGRIWIAAAGDFAYPHGLTSNSPVSGILIRGFEANGSPMEQETFIPVSLSPRIAFGVSGRIAAASVTPLFPLTPAGADGGNAAGATVVAMDPGVGGEPALVCDRERMTVPGLRDATTVYLDSRSLSCKATGDAAVRLSASVLPGSAKTVADASAAAYSVSISDGATPATLTVKNNAAASSPAAMLVAVSPGAQRLLVVPIAAGSSVVTSRSTVTRGFDSIPAPAAVVLEATLAVALEANGAPLAAPFRLTSNAAWLSFDTSEGTAPAEVRLRADATGLARGVYSATIGINALGRGVSQIVVTLTIGSVFRVTGPTPNLQVPVFTPVTQKIQIQSSGAPLDFTIDPAASHQISPMSGTTPAEITVTFDPRQDYAVGDRPRILGVVRSGELVWGLAFTYVMVPRTATVLADSLRGSGAPGKLFYYVAGGTDRCRSTAAAGVPWPLTLGSCTLRINGQPLPLSEVTEAAAPPNPNTLMQPVYWIRAQLPYGIAGVVNVDLEDRQGGVKSLPLTIQPVAPEILGVVGAGPQEVPSRKAGDSMTLLVNGLGATDPAAPLGDVPQAETRPVTSLEAFIGGRSARIVSARLSGTAPGVFEVTVEIPGIAPDTHPVELRAGGVEAPSWAVRVIPE